MNDCETATKFFLQHLSDYDVDPNRVALMGKYTSTVIFMKVKDCVVLQILYQLKAGLMQSPKKMKTESQYKDKQRASLAWYVEYDMDKSCACTDRFFRNERTNSLEYLPG